MLTPAAALVLRVPEAALASTLAPAVSALEGPLRLGLAVLVVTGVALALASRRMLARRDVRPSATWGCGFAAESARVQYTAASLSELALAAIAPRPLRPAARAVPPAGVFPRAARFALEADNPARARVFEPAFRAVGEWFGRAAALPAGAAQPAAPLHAPHRPRALGAPPPPPARPMTIVPVLGAIALPAASGLAAVALRRRPAAGQAVACATLCAGAALGARRRGGGALGRRASRRRRLGLRVDALSAVFLAPICTVCALGAIYGLGYFPQAALGARAVRLQLYYGLATAGMVLLVAASNAHRVPRGLGGDGAVGLPARPHRSRAGRGAARRVRVPRRDARRDDRALRAVRAAQADGGIVRVRSDAGAVRRWPARVVRVRARARRLRPQGRAHAAPLLAAGRARGDAVARLGRHVRRAHQDRDLRAPARHRPLRRAARGVGDDAPPPGRRLRRARRRVRPRAARSQAAPRLPQRREHRDHRARHRARPARPRARRAGARRARARRRGAPRREPRAVQVAPLPRRGRGPARDRHARARPPRRPRPPDARDGDPLPRRRGGDLRAPAAERLRLGVARLRGLPRRDGARRARRSSRSRSWACRCSRSWVGSRRRASRRSSASCSSATRGARTRAPRTRRRGRCSRPWRSSPLPAPRSASPRPPCSRRSSARPRPGRGSTPASSPRRRPARAPARGA